MNKKYYIEAMSDETLARMIDKTLKYEKTSKGRDIKTVLLKIIPAAAAVTLVIGIMNIFPLINNKIDKHSNGVTPGASVISENPIIITSETEKAMPSYAENPELFPDIQSIDEAKSTVLCYMNEEDEIMFSIDAGETWLTQEELNSVIQVDIEESELPDLNTWTYDEVKTWIENEKSKLNTQKNLGKITLDEMDDIFKMYDSWLNCMKRYFIIDDDGSVTWMTKEEFVKAYTTPESKFFTYDEYKEWVENKKTELQKRIGSNYPYNGETVEWTQEMADGIINFYEDRLELVKSGIAMISKTTDFAVPSYTYTICYTLPDGKEIVAGLSAISYGELKNMVKGYLDEQVQKGTMTQEEADIKLAEIS